MRHRRMIIPISTRLPITMTAITQAGSDFLAVSPSCVFDCVPTNAETHTPSPGTVLHPAGLHAPPCSTKFAGHAKHWLLPAAIHDEQEESHCLQSPLCASRYCPAAHVCTHTLLVVNTGLDALQDVH